MVWIGVDGWLDSVIFASSGVNSTDLEAHLLPAMTGVMGTRPLVGVL